jgi:hypothetical protein
VRSQYIVVNPLPAQPVLSQIADTIFCSGAGAYQWYYNGVLITGAVYNYYVAQFDGFYYAVSTNSFGCATASDSAYFVFTGIASSSKENFSIAPNPSSGVFNLMAHKSFSNAELRVTDVSGKIIFTQYIRSTTSYSVGIDLSSLAEGMYFLSITEGAHVWNEKLIVNRKH